MKTRIKHWPSTVAALLLIVIVGVLILFDKAEIDALWYVVPIASGLLFYKPKNDGTERL